MNPSATHAKSSANLFPHSIKETSVAHKKKPANPFPPSLTDTLFEHPIGSFQGPGNMTWLDADVLTHMRAKRSSVFEVMEMMQKNLRTEDDLRCLGMFIAGHKYFGFDPRKGNEITWRYRKKGFYAAFPRPRLKKLHPDAVEACKDDAVRCLQKTALMARRSSILQGTVCLKDFKGHIERPHDAGPYYPFDSALDLFRYRTSVSYFMCWHALNRRETLQKFGAFSKSCLLFLELNTLHEPLGNQKSVLDYRNDLVSFQCALIAFCPDPCYGRKTNGIVPDGTFTARRDPGNPCRGLKDQRCQWNFPQNNHFEDLQRNRFNISCECAKEKPGFAWNSKYHLCVDVDECLNQTARSKCKSGKRCQNTVGAYACMCQPGYLRNPDTRQCEERVKIPRPVYNFSLTNTRHLQKLLKTEGSAGLDDRSRKTTVWRTEG